MSRGARWAANFAAVAGALLWLAGALLHVQVLVVLLVVVEGLPGAGLDHPSLVSLLFWLGWAVMGIVVTAVGGGMRFFAGLMSGEKVAGALAPKIILWHWLRYELYALSLGGLLSGIGVFGLADVLSPVVTLLGFLVGLTAWIYCHYLAKRCGERSDALMWKVREEGMRSGMIPYPAGAVPPRDGVLMGARGERSVTDR